MNLGTIGSLVSLLTFISLIVTGLTTIRAGRLSKEAKELRELRETNLAAMSYIYDMEQAMREAMHVFNFTTKVKKPEVLNRSYIESRADVTQNSELQQLASFVQSLSQSPLKNLISGNGDKNDEKSS